MGVTFILFISQGSHESLAPPHRPHLALLPTHFRRENLLFQRKLPLSQKVQEVIFRSTQGTKRNDNLRRERQEKNRSESFRIGRFITCWLENKPTPPLLLTPTNI